MKNTKREREIDKAIREYAKTYAQRVDNNIKKKISGMRKKVEWFKLLPFYLDQQNIGYNDALDDVLRLLDE